MLVALATMPDLLLVRVEIKLRTCEILRMAMFPMISYDKRHCFVLHAFLKMAGGISIQSGPKLLMTLVYICHSFRFV